MNNTTVLIQSYEADIDKHKNAIRASNERIKQDRKMIRYYRDCLNEVYFELLINNIKNLFRRNK